MARYRSKDETDLAWNRIRRSLTRELDTRVQNFREVVLNRLLTHAWDEYAKSLERGEEIAIESEYKDWVTRAFEQNVQPPLDVSAK